MSNEDFSDLDDNYFIWGRKIKQQAEYFEYENYPKETIIEYLEKCSEMRKENLDPKDLTEIEEIYTEEIHDIFDHYEVSDYIYDEAFRN